MTFPARIAIYSFNCELDHLSVLMFNSQLISQQMHADVTKKTTETSENLWLKALKMYA